MGSYLRALLLALVLSFPGAARAESAQFDLVGPAIDVQVARGGVTLPIAKVPNLAPGDQLSIRADFPPGQSAHYLLVAAFLRGATNPPPESWFFQSQTWKAKQKDGLKITVPADAQQVLVFLAPETGGDFRTLIDAVRGRPGAFVRASQDLNQASLDRSRLDAYLMAVRSANQIDPDRLKKVSPLLARSLTIKLDPSCFDKPVEMQAPCLMQGQDTLVLNDGHSTSIVQALTSGNPMDLAMQLSNSPQAGFGYYSPYVAAAADIARILDGFRTAQYTYIPALASAKGERLSLLLNTPPSFHNPLSVLVAALPAVEPPQDPPLQPVDPKQVYCVEHPDLVLPVVGAPLVFSTEYAHDMVLRLKGEDGQPVDVPVKADAEKGGYFIADTSGLDVSRFGSTLEGYLHGYWGFAVFDGPKFRLQSAGAQHWRVAADDGQALVVGRDDVVHLQAGAAACVEGVTLKPASGEPQTLDWKVSAPDQVAVTVPLKDAEPGQMTLLVKSYGAAQPDAVAVQTFAQAARLDSFEIHAGDASGVLRGARLDEVAGLTLGGVAFAPGALATARGVDELTLSAADPQALARLKAGRSLPARVALKDGRTVRLDVAVAGPRPAVSLIAKSIQPPAAGADAAIQLTDKDELPQGAVLTFSIRAGVPAAFTGAEKIEIGAADGTVLATLSAPQTLVLEDAHVALATLDTGKAFNPSAYGPLRFRLVDADGAGDWQPLATLVRLPELKALKCPAAADQACQLSGTNLFLLGAVSAEAGFANPVAVPEGFTGYDLSVPRPADGKLYVRLHDDPSVVNLANVPTAAASSASTGRRSSR